MPQMLIGAFLLFASMVAVAATTNVAQEKDFTPTPPRPTTRFWNGLSKIGHPKSKANLAIG